MANGVAAITATVTAWKATIASAPGSAAPALICDTRGQVLRARVGPTPATTSVAQASVRPTARIGWRRPMVGSSLALTTKLSIRLRSGPSRRSERLGGPLACAPDYLFQSHEDLDRIGFVLVPA